MKLQVTATVKQVPHDARFDPDWPQGSRHFRVRLTNHGRSIYVLFHQGSAHTEPPTVDDVMECLLFDAAGFENANGFEDWASEYGYDPDSRKAERTYKAVLKQTENLKSLLGHEYRETVFPSDESATA